MTISFHRLLLIAFHLSLLVACAQPQKPTEHAAQAARLDFPVEFYQQAIARGKRVYQLEEGKSLVLVRTYRGGAFARFGHDHVISSRDVRGYVMLGDEQTGTHADIYIPLESLIVDEKDFRKQAGLENSLSETDIAGTRHNMMAAVLQADRYPFVYIHLKQVSGQMPELLLTVDWSMHGVTREIQLPADVAVNGDRMRVSGQLRLKQTDFSMTPFSVMAGALRVEDEIKLRFELHARRRLASN